MSHEPGRERGMIHWCGGCNTRMHPDEMRLDENSGELRCDNCLQNAAEAAWERQCEDFHDGGSTRFRSLAEQQAEARKLK